MLNDLTLFTPNFVNTHAHYYEIVVDVNVFFAHNYLNNVSHLGFYFNFSSFYLFAFRYNNATVLYHVYYVDAIVFAYILIDTWVPVNHDFSAG